MPPDETIATGGYGKCHRRRYARNGTLQTDWGPVQCLDRGRFTEVKRTRGKRLPLKEHPFTRTTIVTVVPSGDIGHWSYSSGSFIHTFERWSEVQSQVNNTVSPLPHYDCFGLVANVEPDWCIRYSCAPTRLGLNPDLLSQAEVKAMTKLRSKSGAPDLQFGQMWAERRETAELLQSASTGTADLVRACGQKDWRKSAAILKGMFLSTGATPKREKARMDWVERQFRKEFKRLPNYAERAIRSTENAILGYNLGISPLLRDVESALTSLFAGDMTAGYFDIRVRARHSRTLNDQISGTLCSKQSQAVGLKDSSFEASVAETHGYDVRMVARPRFSNEALVSRLGLSDLSTPWEAVRLTWLVDYWLSVGKYLEALNVPREFEWVDGGYTQRIIRNVKCKMTSSLHNTSRAGGSGLVNHTKRVTYSKFPFPIPPLSLRMRDLSVTQALNVTALASRSIRDVLQGIF